MINSNQKLEFYHLGQSGFKILLNELTIYIDPYLSNSVERIEGINLKRQTPIFIQPNQINDADYVLITHIHLDHCDLDTIIPLSISSKHCKFIAPNLVCKYLNERGIDINRLICTSETWINLTTEHRVHPVPAAHPKITYDQEGLIENVGYVFQSSGENLIYHSGDTFLVDELVNELKKFIPIKIVMLPVNEHNYFKEKLGIIGNMSLREAFGFAELLKASSFVPMHWDMFKDNSMFEEEIKICYNNLKLPFKLNMDLINTMYKYL